MFLCLFFLCCCFFSYFKSLNVANCRSLGPDPEFGMIFEQLISSNPFSLCTSSITLLIWYDVFACTLTFTRSSGNLVFLFSIAILPPMATYYFAGSCIFSCDTTTHALSLSRTFAVFPPFRPVNLTKSDQQFQRFFTITTDKKDTLQKFLS